MSSQTYTWVGNMKGANEPEALYACNGCGALTIDEDKGTHDSYHEALAQLWDRTSPTE
jgi:hypothetical protein